MYFINVNIIINNHKEQKVKLSYILYVIIKIS